LAADMRKILGLDSLIEVIVDGESSDVESESKDDDATFGYDSALVQHRSFDSIRTYGKQQPSANAVSGRSTFGPSKLIFRFNSELIDETSLLLYRFEGAKIEQCCSPESYCSADSIGKSWFNT